MIIFSVNCGMINISSGSGVVTVPMLTVYAYVMVVVVMITYSATKAFVNNFSQSLAYEYPKIDVLSMTPFLVVCTVVV